MTDPDLLRRLVSGIDEVIPDAVRLRRQLHMMPQVGGYEHETRGHLLDAMPWAEPRLETETGATVRVGPDGPAVGLRAELDALPIVEETGVDWASTNGAMHACGHDVHMAATWALLAAGRGLDLPCGMVGLLQPREECQPSGAREFVELGVVERNEITALVGAHVQPRVRLGVVSTGAGAVNAAYDEFTITVQGHSGHGAYPHVALDPVPVLSSIVLGLHELVSRTIDPMHPTVITVGTLAAGHSPNVIAPHATCSGTIRATSEADRLRIHEDIRRLAEYMALSRGAQADVAIVTGGPVLFNDPGLVRDTDALLGQLGTKVAAEPFRSCGSDDFSYYARRVPILMMFVGMGRDTSDRFQVGLHHELFLPHDDAVRATAHALAAGWVAAAGQASEIRSA